VRNTNQPKHIGVEDRAHRVRRRLGGIVAHRDAGVVDQHVEAAVGGDPVGCGGNGRAVGDVDEDHLGTELVGGSSPTIGVATADDHGVPGRDELTGRLETQPLFAPVISVVVMLFSALSIVVT